MNIDDIKSQLASTVPSSLREDMAHLVDKTRQLDDGRLTTDQLLNQLMNDEAFKRIITTVSQQNYGDAIDAHESQGFVNKPTGPVSQIFFNGTIDPKALIDFIRPSSAVGNQEIYRYKQQFVDALQRITVPQYNFPLTFRLISAEGASSEADMGLPIEQLLKRVQMSRFIILRGAAGSGKSTSMRYLAELLMQNDRAGVVPIYLQLRRLDPKEIQTPNNVATSDTDPEQYIKPLLNASIVPLGIADLKQLGEQAVTMDDGVMLIIADGLNEIYGEEAAGFILKQLTTYVTQRGLNACALVTDRITPRDGITTWQQARIERLTLDVVHAQFAVKKIETLNYLSEADLTLLQTPYFLAYALEHNTSHLSSPAEAVAAFFNQLEFKGDVLDRMAKAAFNAYKDHHSYRFDVAPFIQIVGQDIFDKLIQEGVIDIIPTEVNMYADTQSLPQQAQFDHPLKHDYLAARYLSQHQEAWTPKTLDIVSFESNSFDALSMTLELLPNEELADTFVERVHNWNWAAALVCIAKAMRTGGGRHSQEIQMAVLALVTEKLFDPVQPIRQRANEILSLFPATIATPYKQVSNLNELYSLVQQQVRVETQRTGREVWFSQWSDLFVRSPKTALNEQDLKNIVHHQGIIGWTAANVFRRFELTEPDIRQLHAYYDACMTCDPNDWQASTIRSRVVHALGTSDTQSVVDLLFQALNEDNYVWSRISAARSLVEIAALTTNDTLRHEIIDALIDLVKKTNSRMLAIKTLREIGQSAFYRNAPGAWEQTVTPLIELMRDMQQQKPEEEWWSGLLNLFKDFCKEQTGSAVRAVER